MSMEALAALGTVDWLNWMFLGIAQGFTQGFSVRISQKYGENDKEGIKRAIGMSARLSIAIALICMVLGQVCLPIFLQFLRVPEELWEMAELYIRILFGGFAAVVFYNFCSSVLRAVGDSRTPLKAMVVASFTNILLDLFAVFVLKWGIAGAAIATVLSQCLSGFLCALKIWKTPELHFGKEHIRADSVLEKKLIRIGTPVAVQNIIISIGGMAVQMIVNGFGMSFIAGFTATNKLYGILEIAAISYGYAVTTYVGQNYGALERQRIKSGIRAAVVLSMITSVLIAIGMLVFGRAITMLFISSENPELVTAAGDTAYFYLCTMSVFLPVLYLLHIYRSALQGMGNTMVAMVSGMIEFVLRVGVAVVIGMTGYEMGILAAEPAAWFGAAVFLMVGYYVSVAKMMQREENQDAVR